MITPASDRNEKGQFYAGMKGAHTSHGMEGTNFYSLYYNVRGRCTNPNHKYYKDYGGRGIKCEWTSFEQFRDDMYESYLLHREQYGKVNTTIERIDNHGSYSKENCKWATRLEQASNTRKNVYIEHDGKRMTIFQWAREIGIEPRTMWYRIKNMPVEKALTRPLNKKHGNNTSK